MREILKTGGNFCSVVSRRVHNIRGRRRLAIFKEPRNSFELNLLKHEILFYKTLAPLYNLIYGLHFSYKKFCPTLFESTTRRGAKLVIQDLKFYRTKEILNHSEVEIVIKELAIFHAIGFLLKKIITPPRVSLRTRGNEKWFVYIHKDCWSRNLMICGKKRVKFIDFGFFDYNHCLKDLTYLLFTSTLSDNVHDLCTLYRDQLSINTRKLGLSIEISDFSTELGKTVISVYPLASRIIGKVRRGRTRQLQLSHAKLILDQLK